MSSPKEYKTAAQQASLPHAKNAGERWTEEEDNFLRQNMGTPNRELAIELGRPFYACAKRGTFVARMDRTGQAIQYDWETATVPTSTKKWTTLCACARLDGDPHEDWCP